MRPAKCPECGAKIEPTDLACEYCKTIIEDSKCSACGRRITEETDGKLAAVTGLCFPCWAEACAEAEISQSMGKKIMGSE